MKELMAIGTWAEAYNTAAGGKLLLVDGSDGRIIDQAETGKSISSLLWDSQHQLLFASCETNFHGEELAGGELLCFRIHREDRKYSIESAASLASFGGFPIAEAVSDRFLLILNHGSNLSKVCATYRDREGNLICSFTSDEASLCLFERDMNGTGGRLVDQYIFRGTGKTPFFQDSPSPHDLYIFPDHSLYGVPCRGLDRTFLFQIDPEKKKLILVNTLIGAPGDGPRNMAYYKNWYFVLSEIMPTVTVFERNGRLLQNIFTIPKEKIREPAYSFTSPHPSGLVVDEQRQLLYTITRSQNVLTVFRVGDDGRLTRQLITKLPAGNPRQIVLYKGRLYIVCQDEGCLLECLRDKEGIPTGFQTVCKAIERISFVEFIEVKE